MVKYSKTMKLRAIEAWKEHYIDYKQMKKQIKKICRKAKSFLGNDSQASIVQMQSKSETLHNRSPSKQIQLNQLSQIPASDMAQRLQETRLGKIQYQFLQSMDAEVIKVSQFYQELEFDIQSHLAEALRSRTNWEYFDMQSVITLIEELWHIGNESIQVCNYIELNITAMRKILKKFDKKFRAMRQPVKESYLKSRLDMSNSHLSALLSFHVGFNIKYIKQTIDKISLVLYQISNQLKDLINRKFKKQKFKSGSKRYQAKKVNEENSLSQPLLSTDEQLAKSTQYYRILVSKLRVFKNIVDNIQQAVQQVQFSSSFAKYLSTQLVLSQYNDNLQNQAIKRKGKKFRQPPGILSSQQHPSYLQQQLNEHSKIMDKQSGNFNKQTDYYTTLYLTLLHTFLYMVNYYLFAPTANLYTEALGMTRASSGNVLAMTPVASFTFAILLSWWSNKSFKQPIIAGTMLILIGDVLYAIAYDSKSVGLLLTGRFLFGIGGARAVLRRFIADYVFFSALTKYCAAFVAASALGLALGPGLSSLISFIPDFTMLSGAITFNIFTGPAWISTIIWTIFIVILLLFYKQPDRDKSNNVKKSKQEAIEAMDDDDIQQEDGSEQRSSYKKKRKGPKFIKLGSSDGSPVKIISPDPKSFQNQQFSSYGQHSNPATLSKKLSITPIAADPAEVDEQVDRILQVKKSLCQIYGPTLICLFNLLLLKVIQQALVTSSPIVMFDSFGWNAVTVGYFFCALGSLVIPLNLFVGFISKRISDRKILVISQSIAIAGSLLMIRYGNFLPLAQYLVGIIILFLACQIMESVSTSLLSKVMPSTLALGVLNSGFISTQAGTAGRAVGNFSTSITGSLGDIQNFTYIPITIWIILALLFVLFSYEDLYVTSIRRILKQRNENKSSKFGKDFKKFSSEQSLLKTGSQK